MDTAQTKILIAEDEALLRQLVADFLQQEGYTVLQAADGDEALQLFAANPDTALALLDIMMPGRDGWEVCRQLRALSQLPIIMLTARSEEFDQLLAFECGADEYVTKPFSPGVLVKRVQALLRRCCEPRPATYDRLLEIKPEAYEAYLEGKRLDLTLKEFELLCCLWAHKGQVFTRDQLLDRIWGFDFAGDNRTVDSHVAKLRVKLGEFGTKYLKTVYGVGYKIEG